MSKTLSSCVLAATVAAPTWPVALAEGHAEPRRKVGIDACLATVLAKYSVDVLQAVLKDKKQALWETEVDPKYGNLWDVEFSHRGGKITEVEQRVASGDEPAFKPKTNEQPEGLHTKSSPVISKISNRRSRPMARHPMNSAAR